MINAPNSLSRWRHYKSKGGDDHTYEVLGVFVHSETHEPMVAYRPLYDVPHDSWVYGYPGAVRPLSIWYDMVEYEGKHVQRFTEIAPVIPARPLLSETKHGSTLGVNAGI